MLGGQSIIEDDRQITRFSKLHPQLAMGGWAAERPSTAVQVDDHRMSTGTLGHRDVSTQARTQLEVLFETVNCWKILVVNGRQLFPSAALRNSVAGRIPDRQLTQNLTVAFADHRSYQLPFALAALQLRPASYLCSSVKAVGVAVLARRTTTAGSAEIGPLAAVSNSFAHTRKSCICNGTTTCLLFLPAGFATLSGHLIDRELVELAALSDEGREPPRSSATACPRLAARSAILRRNFAPFQRRAAAQSGPKISRSAAAFSA